MKIKNLLVVPLLGLSLVAIGACGTTGNQDTGTTETPTTEPSGTSVIPVARITVKKLADCVVGDVINLDEYVTVIHTDDSTSKNFTVEVALKSRDLVTVNGHNVTIVGEGTINLNIKAGEDTAKFTTTAMSLLKKTFKEDLSDISQNFAFMDVEEDGSLSIGTVHQPNYTVFSNWHQDSDKNAIPGGLLKTNKGNTFGFSLDANYENIKVDSEKWHDFDNYYVNMPISIPFSEFETRHYTPEDEDEEEYDYLYLSPSVTSTNGYSANAIDQIVLTNAYSLSKSYVYTGLEVRPVELTKNGETLTRYLFTTYVAKASTPTVVEGFFTSQIMFYDEDNIGVQAVEDYIESGAEPVSETFTEVPDFFKSLKSAENFTMTTTSKIVYENLDEEPEGYVTTEETTLVNENGTQTTYVRHAKEDTTTVTGYVEKDDKLYSYAEGEDDALVATEEAGKTSLFDDGIEYTAAYLATESLYSGFYVSKRTTLDDGSLELTISPEDSKAFLTAYMNLTNEGRGLLEWIDQYDAEAVPEGYSSLWAAGYDAKVVIGDGFAQIVIAVFIGSDDAKNYLDEELTTTINAIGSTAEIDFSGIQFE